MEAVEEVEAVLSGEPFLLQQLPVLFQPPLFLLFYQPSLVEEEVVVAVGAEVSLLLQILSLQLPALLVVQVALEVSLLLLLVAVEAEAALWPVLFFELLYTWKLYIQQAEASVFS